MFIYRILLTRGIMKNLAKGMNLTMLTSVNQYSKYCYIIKLDKVLEKTKKLNNRFIKDPTTTENKGKQ